MNPAPKEADKELERIIKDCIKTNDTGSVWPDFDQLKRDLLAWRDKSQQALYHRLAAEAVEAKWHNTGELGTWVKTGKAVPLSKLKAIMEIKDEENS